MREVSSRTAYLTLFHFFMVETLMLFGWKQTDEVHVVSTD